MQITQIRIFLVSEFAHSHIRTFAYSHILYILSRTIPNFVKLLSTVIGFIAKLTPTLP
jgi:hypothetical protein